MFDDGIGGGRAFLEFDEVLDLFEMRNGLFGKPPSLQASIFNQNDGLLLGRPTIFDDGKVLVLGTAVKDFLQSMVVEIGSPF